MTSIDLKVELMGHLEEFRTYGYAFKLCHLLIKIADMPAEVGENARNFTISLHNCNEHNRYTFSYIKKIITDGLAEKLVEKIFDALDAPKEKSDKEAQQLLQVLLKSDEYEEEPCEYLNQLKTVLTSSVIMFSAASRKDFNILERLQEYLLLCGRSCIDNLLFAIFQCILDKICFSYEEKKKIGDTFIEAAQILDILIQGASLTYHYKITIDNLKRRSALQFIKDILVEIEIFKENIATLEAVIQYLDRSMLYKTRSKAIKYFPKDKSDENSFEEDSSGEDRFSFEEDSSNAMSDYETDSSDAMNDYETDSSGSDCNGCDNSCADFFDKIDASGLPKEHTWWQMYKHTFFK